MKTRPLTLLIAVAFLLTGMLAGCESVQNLAARFAPSAEPTLPTRHMVATAHPHATAAGLDVLRRGGSAVDAAIAVQMVLTLVEPESSGIGGGAFMLTFDPATGAVQALDGRETAPASATPDLNLDADGKPLAYFEKMLGGKSVGVPGVIAMLELAHKQHGKLPWQDLFDDAIALAEEGFEVSPKLHAWLTRLPSVNQMPDMKAYFTVDGVPHPTGSLIRNPAYAKTLRTLRDGGAEVFYEGALTDEIIAAVASAPKRQAVMTRGDFAAYEAIIREPVCGPYKVYKICTMPSPSSGVTLLQIMQTLDALNLQEQKPNSVEAVHLIAEASRLAFADRDRFIADPAFADVPAAGLLNARYLKERGRAISPEKSMGKAEPGTPPGGAQAFLQGDDASPEHPSTSHFSIVDDTGFAVSTITTIEGPFGSHVMAGGFLLNNELSDFSSLYEIDGRRVANRVEPGKRPRSSMVPTFVFDKQGDLYIVVGSSGGSTIPGAVIKTLIGLLDWDMTMQEAIDLPNVINRNGPTLVEPDLKHLKASLEALGHEVSVRSIRSGINAIRITPKGFDGGADKRRIGNFDGD